MPEKVRDVKSALTKKGFQEQKGDHWYYFYVYNNKRTAINTKISYGEIEMDRTLCSWMAKQIKLSNPQFKDFVDCRLTKEKYLAHLVEAKHILPEPAPDQSQQK